MWSCLPVSWFLVYGLLGFASFVFGGLVLRACGLCLRVLVVVYLVVLEFVCCLVGFEVVVC